MFAAVVVGFFLSVVILVAVVESCMPASRVALVSRLLASWLDDELIVTGARVDPHVVLAQLALVTLILSQHCRQLR